MSLTRRQLSAAGLILVVCIGLSGAGRSPVCAQQPAAKVESQKPRVDLYGDPLPPGAIARLGTVRFRALDEADALAFAPDGKTIAVNSRGGLFLFEADSGKRVKQLTQYGYIRENILPFSPDGKRFAALASLTVSDGQGKQRSKGIVRVSELTGEGKPREYDAERVIWLGWSADSVPLAVCLEKGAITLLELTSARSRRFECQDLRRPELSNYVLCACAPVGQTLAVADEQNTIHVWDTATGAERCTVQPNKDDTLRGLAVSPDGRLLATLQQGRASPYQQAVLIWDAMSGRTLRTVGADHKNLSTLAFAPDGKTLTTAGWNGIGCWDVATGRARSRSEGEGSNTLKIAFSGDSQTLATLQRHSNAFHYMGRRHGQAQGRAGRPRVRAVRDFVFA
jgi:WD40 repeat protein